MPITEPGEVYRKGETMKYSPVKASVQEILANRKAFKKTTPSQNLAAELDEAVKAGKLTQEQANMARGANRNSMFSMLLDSMTTDSGSSTTTDPTSTDPFSILLDAFKTEDKTKTTDSPLFDSFVSLMPTNPATYAQDKTKAASAPRKSALPKKLTANVASLR